MLNTNDKGFGRGVETLAGQRMGNDKSLLPKPVHRETALCGTSTLPHNTHVGGFYKYNSVSISL